MLLINLQNIEELIFFDSDLRSRLPDLRHILDQWMLAHRISALRSLRIRSLADMLNSLTPEHIRVLEEYFRETITLDKLDYHIVKDLTLRLDHNDSDELSSFDGFVNFAVCRDERYLYLTTWR